MNKLINLFGRIQEVFNLMIQTLMIGIYTYLYLSHLHAKSNITILKL